MPSPKRGRHRGWRLSFWLEEGDELIGLQAVVAASFVAIGVLVAVYAQTRTPLASLPELRANIWEADGYFASLEAKKDSLSIA